MNDLEAKGAAVHLVPPITGRTGRIFQRIFNPYLNLSKRNLDLIVISSGGAYDPAYLPTLGQFLLETNIPFIFICHFNAETFWVDDRMRLLMAAIFQRAQMNVFVCHENHRLTERQLGMTIPRTEIIVEPLFLDQAEPVPWPERANDSPWRFACVARLEPRWKGQDVLFEVLADGKWKSRNYILSLFGKGAEEQYLRKLSRFYGLEGKVFFVGFSNPIVIWREHHLQVLATRGEGGPIVISEGMMCGRTAVTTRCGTIADYMSDGKNGFMAAFATSECFGAKMEEAWNRREDWKAMGIMAHCRIREKLTDFNAADRLLKLILRKAN